MEEKTSESIRVPEFSGTKLQILEQLLELANARIANEVWYTIERSASEAAKIVSELLDEHMYSEEGARWQGETPIRFADFVIAKLREMINEERQRASYKGEVAGTIAVAAAVDLDEPSETPAETPAQLARRVRLVVGGTGKNLPGRRQYSNTHHKRRR